MSTNVMSNSELFTVDEVATYFRVHPMTVRDWIKRGILIGFKAGRDWRFNRKNVEDCARRLQEITEEKKSVLTQVMELVNNLSEEQLAELKVQLEARLEGHSTLTGKLTVSDKQ